MSGFFTRRAVLAGAGVTAAAAGGGAWTLAPGAAAQGLEFLTRSEARTVEAAAEVFFPGVHFPLSGLEVDIVARVDHIAGQVMDPVRRSAFRYVLRALEWGTLASRGRRFTDLSRAERREVLETWEGPDVVARRVAGESLKAILGMAYFAHPEIQSAMGFRTGCGGAV